jgi:hypothetical protein
MCTDDLRWIFKYQWTYPDDYFICESKSHCIREGDLAGD